MARPANQQEAARIVRNLLIRRISGSRRGTVRPHLQRAANIAETIWRRWQVGPYQWQVKHLRWYLVEKTKHLKSGTRYRYWLTVRFLVFTLAKERDWLPYLQGPWVWPTGNTANDRTER
ncbi:MAG: hypothetical protein OEZ39_14795 [Gammaproteobacteria bacterium]|nr:hypothetical protein [Gammaproteobacteria bacterium]